MAYNGKKPLKHILIIEDDQDVADLVKLHLNDHNYETVHCDEGQLGLETALSEKFDLLILDLMLPDLDGFEICRRLRANHSYLPILILTSRTEEMDRVLGLELGADDYLTKPFSIRELLARVKAIFRRIESVSELADNGGEKKLVSFGDLEIDMQKRKVSLSGKVVELTVKEFDLLKLFANNPGRAYSREDLLNIVWGYSFDGYDHTVNSHINRLRVKIENDPANPRFIKTVWGFGYRFAEEPESVQ
jgi:two-component system, OmpR family, alkaline phosphatase synthesis response regulator PhoP